MTNGDHPTLEDARSLLERDGRHAVLLHIAKGKKGPEWGGWAKMTYAETLAPEYQARLRSQPNTGILLGAPSDDLCAIDLDTEAALEAFLALNPAFATTLRTHGARGAQLWVYVQGDRPHQIHSLKVDKDSPLAVGCEKPPDSDGKNTIGEFRAEGGQSVVRGVHPRGCRYTWLVANPPITIAFSDIRWPADIVKPWEPSPDQKGGPNGPEDQSDSEAGDKDGGPNGPKAAVASNKTPSSDPIDELLKRAKTRLSIDFLWQHFGFNDRRHNPVASPFRSDNTDGHPSFSIYKEKDGELQRFRDHNSSYEHHRGDAYDFYQLAKGQDAKQAFTPFVELAGLGDELVALKLTLKLQKVTEDLLAQGFALERIQEVLPRIDQTGSIQQIIDRVMNVILEQCEEESRGAAAGRESSAPKAQTPTQGAAPQSKHEPKAQTRKASSASTAPPRQAGPKQELRPIIMHPQNDRYISEFARELGGILKSHGFYRFHGIAVQVRPVTVKARNGKEHQVKRLVDLPVPLFSTVIETYCSPAIWTKNNALAKKSVSLEVAARTMVCLEFVEQLPEIKLWSDVRLPIRNGNQIILTKSGYDSESGVYTSPDAPEVDETLTITQAAKEWRKLLNEFCFPKSGKSEKDEPDEKKREPERERCFAVALAAALTPLCLYLLPEKAKRPGFAASANAEGAGKTLLLSFGMVAKLGFVPTGSAPDNEEEMRKVLDSAVHYGVPILFFDNLKGHLSSGELEAFITGSTRRYRMLGTTNYTEADNLSTVYITANFATYSPDLRRRLLAVELFLEEARAEERAIKDFLNEDALIKMRPRLVSILWAFIRSWHKKGETAPAKLLPSFEEWSKLVAGIVESAGFSSPCQLAMLKTGGDTDTQDMEKLVGEMNPGAEFRFSELIDLARDHHLFQRLIPSEGDMEKKQSTRLGLIIRKFVGRTFNARHKFCLSEGTRKTERYFVHDLSPENGKNKQT